MVNCFKLPVDSTYKLSSQEGGVHEVTMLVVKVVNNLLYIPTYILFLNYLCGKRYEIHIIFFFLT